MSLPPVRSLPVLAIKLEGIKSSNPDAQALVDVVREVIAQAVTLEERIKRLEAETKRLRGES